MRLLLLAAASLSCACTGNTGGTQSRTAEPVRLENRAIVEASGLARSHYYDDRLWTLNDGGSSPALYAFFTDGRDAATVRLRGADNIDWEDLASFSLDGRHWLFVGEVGDNAAGRSFVTRSLAFPIISLFRGSSPVKIRPRIPAAVQASREPGRPTPGT